MRSRTQAVLDRLSLTHRSGCARRIAVRRASAAAAGGPRAGLRLPDPRARRADDGADRRGGGSPVRRAARVEGERHDDPLRLAPPAGSLPACDRITVLRDGSFVDTFTTASVTHQRHREGDGGPGSAAQASSSGPSGRAEARSAKADALPTTRLSRLPSKFRNIDLSVARGRDRRHLRSRRLRPLGAARNDLRPAPRRPPARSALDGAAGRRFDRRATPRAPASCSCPRSGSGRPALQPRSPPQPGAADAPR